jgi:hypothetical protein
MIAKSDGSLAEHDFPDLVQELHRSRWTGLLTLTHMGVGRNVTVQEGRLVFGSSSSPDDRLGELLFRRGRITLRQFLDAGKAVTPGKRLGTILVEQGILEPKDLVRAVVEHTQEIIYGAFQFTEGRYLLQEGASSPESITLNIRTPDIIVEGIRRIEAWSRVDKGIGGIEARYARPDDYAEATKRMTLSPEKLQILTTLNEPKSVETICSESSLSGFEVCRTLWAFRVIGAITRVDPPTPPGPEATDDGMGFVIVEE